MMDLDIGVVQDVEKRQKKRLLLDYLADNLKHHNWWAYRYFFCEFLALVNIIGKNHRQMEYTTYYRRFYKILYQYLSLSWQVIIWFGLDCDLLFHFASFKRLKVLFMTARKVLVLYS